jgi:hypothetical protein
MRLLVGCPLVGNPEAGRNWILDKWYEHLMTAGEKAGVVPEVICNVHPDDADTVALLTDLKVTFFYSVFTGRDGDHRWSNDRYYEMVNLRNELLGEVRNLSPDYFFSLDSDVLLHPDGIKTLLSAVEEKPDAWAIGSKCFVSRHSTLHPNMGKWVGPHRGTMFKRENLNQLVKVDILIGGYLMTRNAYAIDYVYNRRGEDLGWSLEIQKAGGTLYWDGRVCNKHVMHPAMLNGVDKRVGF